MTRFKVALSVLAVIASLAIAAPAKADVSTTACYPVDGRFVNRYNQLSAQFGCAVYWAQPTGNGLYQNFERGQMVWSPNQGGNMIVSAYYYTYWTDRGQKTGIAFQWGYTDPFNYQKWLIRLDRNGANLGQWDCWSNTWAYTCTRTNGSWGWGDVLRGYAYRIVIEGCDVDAWGGHTCRQGWTIPVWMF